MTPKPFKTSTFQMSSAVPVCSRCRVRNTKCDGNLPSCVPCERAGVASQCRRPSEQVAKSRGAIDHGYQTRLQSRLQRLHREIKETKTSTEAWSLESVSGGAKSELDDRHKMSEASDALKSDYTQPDIGIIAHLFQSCSDILVSVAKDQKTKAALPKRDMASLRRSVQSFIQWADSHEVMEGTLDGKLQSSQRLRNTTLDILRNIGVLVTKGKL